MFAFTCRHPLYARKHTTGGFFCGACGCDVSHNAGQDVRELVHGAQDTEQLSDHLQKTNTLFQQVSGNA